MANLKKLILVSSASSLLVVGLAGCQYMHRGGSDESSGRTAGRVLDDKTITSKVKEKLSSAPEYKFNSVDVKTYDGIVQLSGFVAAQGQKQRAGELAQSVEGVGRVENQITVQTPPNMKPTGRQNQQNQPVPASTGDTNQPPNQ
jgi:hyperosmotically inducible periplasmic protein